MIIHKVFKETSSENVGTENDHKLNKPKSPNVCTAVSWPPLRTDEARTYSDSTLAQG